MAELPQKKTLTVFLASPGDLKDERRRTHEVVDELNRSLCRPLDIYIDLLGWEDTLPGYGRPQEQIDRDLDKCQLFIGMLWERWGTPPGDQYSSGFEEEFERARSRRIKTEEPEIWLAFKRVDPARLQDPGEQLKQVIAFRQAQEAARKVFFKEFLDQDDWAKQLRSWLMGHIGELIRKEREELRKPSPSDAVPSPIVSAESHEAPESTRNSTLPTQLAEAMAELHHGVASGDLNTYIQTLESLPRVSTTRLFLALKATITARFSAETLSTHEINLLYRDKVLIDPLQSEAVLLLRTILSDPYSTEPGWYWFRDADYDAMLEYILYLIEQEFTLEEQVNALKLLADLGIPFPENDYSARLLKTHKEAILHQLVRWIGKVGLPQHVTLLEDIERRSAGMSEAVFSAKVLIKAREEPKQALQLILDKSAHPKEVFDSLGRNASSLSSEALFNALKSPNQAVRLFAARLLVQRGELSVMISQSLLADPSVDVREVAVRTLIEKGLVTSSDEIKKIFKDPPPAPVVQRNPFSLGFGTAQEYDPTNCIALLFTKKPLDQLIEAIDWYSVEGPLAYQTAATQYFEQFGSQVRQDLKDNFETVKQRSLERLRAQFSNEIADKIADKIDEPFNKFNDFIRGQFSAAALAGLVLHGSLDDRSLARGYLTPNWNNLMPALQINVARILKRFGTPEDVEYFFALVTQSYGEARREMAQTILALAPGINTIRRLLETDDSDLVRIGLSELSHHTWDDVWPTVQKLLHHKQDRIRLAAVALLCSKRAKEDLILLLDKYVSNSSYYYNVVCWLDRILFAPGLFGDRFRACLEQEVSSA